MPDESVAAPERVYRALRKAILEGDLGPRERLTSLSVGEQLGVSRTPVRAALARLEAEGLVDREGGQSARVRPLTADEVEEAYDVAMGIEGMLVYRLAQRGTEEQLDELATTVGRMEAAAQAGDKRAWVDADERFHALLVLLGSNSLAGTMMDRVEIVVGRVRFLSLHAHPEGAAESARDHRAVVEAIRSREPEDARHRHQLHWERVRAANITFLRETLSGRGGYVLTPRRPAPSLREEAEPTT